MNDVIYYICGNLRNSEKAINSIVRTLHKQTKFNKRVLGLVTINTVYIMVQYARTTLMAKEIEELRKEIAELKDKNEKGE